MLYRRKFTLSVFSGHSDEEVSDFNSFLELALLLLQFWRFQNLNFRGA